MDSKIVIVLIISTNYFINQQMVNIKCLK